jgi:hypothetical protein
MVISANSTPNGSCLTQATARCAVTRARSSRVTPQRARECSVDGGCGSGRRRRLEAELVETSACATSGMRSTIAMTLRLVLGDCPQTRLIPGFPSRVTHDAATAITLRPTQPCLALLGVLISHATH